MMDKFVSILIVPTEGDPMGLLAEGPCGLRPSLVWKKNDGSWSPGRECYILTEDHVDEGALVLAWDNKPVASACLIACGEDFVPAKMLYDDIASWFNDEEPNEYITDIADSLDFLGLFILLDVKGREVGP
jgi:hypothetical protein